MLKRWIMLGMVLYLVLAAGCTKNEAPKEIEKNKTKPIEASKSEKESPSKAETIAFLKDKIKLAGGGRIQDSTYTINFFDIDDSGTLTYSFTDKTPNRESKETMTVSLKELNYSSTNVETIGNASIIKIECGNCTKTVDSSFSGNLANRPPEHVSGRTPALSFVLSGDRTTAERFGKALSHLVKLCGGKGEAF